MDTQKPSLAASLENTCSTNEFMRDFVQSWGLVVFTDDGLT